MYTNLIIINCMLNIYSINANGLKDVDKFKSLCALLGEWKSDFCLIQESFWTDEFVDGIKHIWNGHIYTCNTKTNHAGVAILVSAKWKNNVKLVHKDDIGRTLIVEVKNDDFEIKLMSVYAPTQSKDRITYFEYLSQYISDNNVIIGGDFNTTFSKEDRCNTIHNFDRAYYKLNEIIANNNLYDIWRHRNNDSKFFSWKRVINGVVKMSRIDFYLVSQNLGNYIKNVFYKHTTMSDHNFIYMKIDFSLMERGPGVWIFNNQFLQEENFKKEIRCLIEKEKTDILFDREFIIWWDNIKYKIRKKCQIYGKIRNKSRYKEYNYIQKQITKFHDAANSQDKFDIVKYEQLRDRLATIEYELCQGAILRSKAKWAVDSDKNTKYFLSLEKFHQSKNSITELLSDEGNLLTDTNTILQEEYSYYEKLYSCVNVNEEDIDNFILDTPNTLDSAQQRMCDKSIDRDEIYNALSTMAKNKSPGSDGLTVEFYLEFRDIFVDLLSKLFECIENDSIMSRSMRYGHITLIYKKGDTRLLKNWRPISLLNVDYKILSRIFSNRLKNVLPSIIYIDQTSCVIGRDISDTVASVRD